MHALRQPLSYASFRHIGTTHTSMELTNCKHASTWTMICQLAYSWAPYRDTQRSIDVGSRCRRPYINGSSSASHSTITRRHRRSSSSSVIDNEVA